MVPTLMAPRTGSARPVYLAGLSRTQRITNSSLRASAASRRSAHIGSTWIRAAAPEATWSFRRPLPDWLRANRCCSSSTMPTGPTVRAVRSRCCGTGRSSAVMPTATSIRCSTRRCRFRRWRGRTSSRSVRPAMRTPPAPRSTISRCTGRRRSPTPKAGATPSPDWPATTRSSPGVATIRSAAGPETISFMARAATMP